MEAVCMNSKGVWLKKMQTWEKMKLLMKQIFEKNVQHTWIHGSVLCMYLWQCVGHVNNRENLHHSSVVTWKLDSNTKKNITVYCTLLHKFNIATYFLQQNLVFDRVIVVNWKELYGKGNSIIHILSLQTWWQKIN